MGGKEGGLEEDLRGFDEESLKGLLEDYDLDWNESGEGGERLEGEELKEELIGVILENLEVLKGGGEGGSKGVREEVKRLGAGERRSEGGGIKKDTWDFIGYRGERVYLIDKKDEKGNKKVLLFGNVVLEFRGYKLYADQVLLGLDENNDFYQAVATGDLLIENEQGDRVIGTKMLLYGESQRAEIYQGVAYKEPFYIVGEEASKVSGKKYIFSNGMLTSEDIQYPHYQIKYRKGWLYGDEFLWVEGATYRVGNTDLFYSPIYFKSLINMGIKTSFGYEKGINWYIHNTMVYIPGSRFNQTTRYIQEGSKLSSGVKDLGLKFKLDYYQKMGLYLGHELLYKVGDYEVYVDLGFAVDRSLKYIGGEEILTNYFDQDEDGKKEETNNIRWKLATTMEYDIFSEEGASAGIEVDFSLFGEPYFEDQFESRRKVDFNLYELFAKFGSYKTDSNIRGGGFGSEGNGVEVEFYAKYSGVSLNITGDFNFSLERDGTRPFDPPNNAYETSSYKNYKDEFYVPKLRLGYSNYVQLIGSEKPVLEVEKKKKDKKKKEEEEAFLEGFKELEDFEKEDDEEKDEEEKKKEEEEEEDEAKKAEDKYLSPELKRRKKLSYSLPLIYNISYGVSQIESYKTGQTNDLESTIFTGDGSLGLSLPFNLSYRFLILKLSSGFNINQTLKETKGADEEEGKSDKELSYVSWNNNSSGSLEFHFFDGYEYLKLILGASVTYGIASRFDEIYREGDEIKGEAGRSENWGLRFSLDILKTKFSVGFSDNIYISEGNRRKIEEGSKSEEEVLKDQRGNLTLSVVSEVINFLTISDTWTRSRREDKDLSNRLSLDLKILEQKDLFWLFYLNSISYSLTWYDDFINLRNSSLSGVFNIDFNIGEYWRVIYSVTSSNKFLYYYTDDASEYGKIKRSIWQDLLDSINIFDRVAQEGSLFKLDSMNFKVIHDLHEWLLEVSVDLKLRKHRKGSYYFEPSLYFMMYLRDFPSFRYPEIRETLTKQ